MKTIKNILLFSFLLLALAAPAMATVGQPVRISLDDPTGGAIAGKPYIGNLIIESVEGVVVSDLKLSGEGWTITSFASQGDLVYSRPEKILIPFEIKNKNPRQSLIFSCQINGKPYTKTLDVSDESFAISHQPRSTKPMPDYMLSSISNTAADPGIKNISAPPAVEQSASADKGDTRSQSIRVVGRFMYVREDGIAIGADNMWIKVRDEDVTFDEVIGTGMTDYNGNFDFTVSFSGFENPDVYLEFEAENSVVVVQDFWEFEYSWETPTRDDYTGHYLNYGTLIPGDESSHGAIHISNTVVRAWRYLNYHQGHDLDQIDVIWPDGDNAHYNAVFEEIHISNYKGWWEDTICHEYGHHFMTELVDLNIPDYCNGICDTEGFLWDDCGHCMWCEENQEDAFGEGVPNWISDVITRYIDSYYDHGVMYSRPQENLHGCSEGGGYGAPLITEGFVGALLRDMEDYGEETPDGNGWTDAMGVGPDKIFDCLVTHEREEISDFITDFYNDYPQYRESFWETATFNTFDLDNTDPGVVSSIQGSIPEGGSSSDSELEFTWNKAPDNFSGIMGYSVRLSQTPNAAPDYGLNTEYGFGYQTYGSEGTWYLTVRAQDRSGNWSDSYVSYGPFTVLAPEPSDLMFYDGPNWDFPALPSTGNSCSVGDCRVPDELPGNVPGTQWNFFATNAGQSHTSTWFDIRVYFDGVTRDTDYCQDPIGGDYYAYAYSPVNLGNLNIRGGRHTFGVYVDRGGRIAETNEFNNTYARQFLWSGYDLNPGTVVSRVTPPVKTGGFSWLANGGMFAGYNCDGFRLDASSWWNVVTVIPDNEADDYDCYLYEEATSASLGYYWHIGASRRPAGMLDAVFVNNNTMGGQANYDVGVTNSNGGSGNFKIQQVPLSSYLSFGDSLTITMGEDEYLIMDEVYISDTNAGPVSITVMVDPQDGPLYLAWLGKDFTIGPLSDATHQTITDENGWARLDFEAPEAGYCAYVLYRDNLAGQDMAVTVEISGSNADFQPLQPDGWFSCLVPRPTADGTHTIVDLPEYLVGNEASTYLNIAVENTGMVGVERLRTRIALDGQHKTVLVQNNFSAQSQRTYNTPSAWSFPGGRHTLSMETDYENVYEEVSESNNGGGHQYVWSPLEMSDGDTAVRPSPQSRIGGWDIVGHAWYNCDGLRMMHAPSTWWGAAVVVPGDTSNVDIRLHEASDNTTDGFAQNLAWSGWGVGQSDYVIVNYNQTNFADYDVGVLHTSGEQDYTVHYVSGQYLGWFPAGESSPTYTIAAGEVMELLEYQFNAGHYVIELDNISGDVNWGMTMHSTDDPFQTKSSSLPGAMAWLNGPGQGESIEFDIPTEGYYCLAVWKNETTDVAMDGQFQLQFRDVLSPVHEGNMPEMTGLTGVTPNPFNPQTTISFNLASEGTVKLEIYDLRGKLARSLAQGGFAAGQHDVVWDGRDNGGYRLSSGVYMVRMQSQGVNEIQKVLMLK